MCRQRPRRSRWSCSGWPKVGLRCTGIAHLFSHSFRIAIRNLERDGLVSRRVFAAVPPRVEYAVTPLGRTILPAVKALAMWALDHSDEIQVNRNLFDDRLIDS